MRLRAESFWAAKVEELTNMKDSLKVVVKTFSAFVLFLFNSHFVCWFSCNVVCKVVCITVLTGNRMGWTARCGRPPLLLPSCKKLEFRLSALMDSDLAWINGKSGRQSWRYHADAFQRSIISEAIYHAYCINIDGWLFFFITSSFYYLIKLVSMSDRMPLGPSTKFYQIWMKFSM